MMGVDILLFLAVGLVAGAIAGAAFRRSGLGWSGNLAVGVLGAMLGGFLGVLLGTDTLGLALVLAAAGAVLLLVAAVATSSVAGARARRHPHRPGVT